MERGIGLIAYLDTPVVVAELESSLYAEGKYEETLARFQTGPIKASRTDGSVTVAAAKRVQAVKEWLGDREARLHYL